MRKTRPTPEEQLESLYQLARSHDVGVYYYDLGDGRAVTVSDGDFAAIALNPNRLEPGEELECLCHELGHLETGTLHPPDADPTTILRCEYKCSYWVVRRLVPVDELIEAIRDGYREDWQLAEYFGVSAECILDAIKIYRNKGLLGREILQR